MIIQQLKKQAQKAPIQGDLSFNDRMNFKEIVKKLEKILGCKIGYVHEKGKSGWYLIEKTHSFLPTPQYIGKNKAIAYHKLVNKYDRFLN